jgi:hypothetical protein
MDFPCANNSCIVFTVLLLIMAASCVHAQLHAPQLTAISWGGQFYPGAIIHRRLYRRLGKDYEVLPSSSEAMIYIAMTRLMVRRQAAS